MFPSKTKNREKFVKGNTFSQACVVKRDLLFTLIKEGKVQLFIKLTEKQHSFQVDHI